MEKTRNGVSWIEAAKRGGAKSREKKLKRVKEYKKNPTLCSFCKKSFPYEKRKNKFCNRSCSASFNNVGVIRNEINGRWKKKKCLCCGEETKNQKFCGIDCFFKYQKDQKREEIKKSGILTYYRADKWYLIETRGYKCERCGTEKWMNEPIPLDTHHKDGDSDNNYLNNLLLICPNCHRQTNNHGSKNKTNSKRKQYRKNRYDKGLSY